MWEHNRAPDLQVELLQPAATCASLGAGPGGLQNGSPRRRSHTPSSALTRSKQHLPLQTRPPSLSHSASQACRRQSHCPKAPTWNGQAGRCAHVLSRSQVKKVLGPRTAPSEAQNLPHGSRGRASRSLPELSRQPQTVLQTCSGSRRFLLPGPGPPPAAAMHPGTWEGAIANAAGGRAGRGLHAHLLPGPPRWDLWGCFWETLGSPDEQTQTQPAQSCCPSPPFLLRTQT